LLFTTEVKRWQGGGHLVLLASSRFIITPPLPLRNI
jgi:hypothetical protein